MIKCLFCSQPYGPERLPILVPTSPKTDIVAWCEHCNPRLTMADKVGAIVEVFGMLRVCYPGPDYDALESEACRTVEQKALLTYH